MSSPEKPVALFVFGAFRKQSGGLSRAWYQRLIAFHNEGWEIHLALCSYRRYRRTTLEQVLGGPLPEGITIHKFWDEPMNKVQRGISYGTAAAGLAVRKALRKPVKKLVTEDRGAEIREWSYDRFGRLLLELDRNKETEQPIRRTWFDIGGNWVIKEWLGVDEEDPLSVQLSRDPAPRPIAKARAEWLASLGLPPGTVAMGDSPYFYPVIAELPDTFGRIYVFHLQHLTYGEDAMGALTKRMAAFFDPNAYGADSVAVSTVEQANDLRTRYGQDYPVDFVHPVVRKVQGDPSIARDSKRVVSVGRIVDIKRIHLTVDAMALVVKQVPDAYLEIWGSGIEAEFVQEHIEKTGMSKHVRMMGYTPNPEKVFRGAACSVLTSRREAFGLVVIESMMQGCPVVGFDVKYGPSGIIKSGVNGYLVKDKDLQGIADGIISILTNPDLAKSMSVEAEKTNKVIDHDQYQDEWNELGLKVRKIALDRSTKN